MSDIGYLKGQCENCGGHLEFPAAGTGLKIDCPHCGVQTTLTNNPPVEAARTEDFPAGPKSKFSVVGGSIILILIMAAAGGAFYWFKKPESDPPGLLPTAPPATTPAEIPTPAPPSPATNDLLVAGPVTLQKTDGSALVYAVGTVKNNSDRQRFGVKIELDLLDAQDNKIGTTSDYIAILEPHKNWQFRALLAQPKAVKANAVEIEEQK
jgi:hypothetical protein